MDKCKSCKFGIWLNADQVYFCLTNESKVYRPEVCVTWEPHNNGWHPFRQERNQETGLWEFVDPPVDGQQILVTIRSQNGVLQDFVIEDIWYEDGYDHLESGYMPCAEAIAWKEWPEPIKEDQMSDPIDRRTTIKDVCEMMKACFCSDGDMNEVLDAIESTINEIPSMQPKEKLPCDVCKYNPPSSMDGKPCAFCPATPVEDEDGYTV